MLPLKTILHPTDFSDHSNYAFELACSLARDHGGHVVLAHVAPAPVSSLGGPVWVPPLPAEYPNEELKDKLARLQSQAPDVCKQHILVYGEAASEILRLARETSCDLIVMGTHGRTGFGRLLLGSLADQVIRRAPCPVVTVRNRVGQAAAFPAAPGQVLAKS
jgi:nucleotide-binding universal stress UspA family protein